VETNVTCSTAHARQDKQEETAMGMMLQNSSQKIMCENELNDGHWMREEWSYLLNEAKFLRGSQSQ
jgi:hypothetical protein